MIAFVVDSLRMLAESIAEVPAIWFAVALIAAIGGWSIGFVRTRARRLPALASWVCAPLALTTIWFLVRNAGEGDRAFDAALLLVVAGMGLPLWAAFAIAGLVISRRTRPPGKAATPSPCR